MKNRLLSKITFIFLLGFIVLSCNKEDDASIEIDKTEINLLNDETEVLLTINSNVDWVSSFNGNQEYIQCSPSSGKPGTTQIAIKASPNTAPRNRNTILSITGGGTTATVQIKQSPLAFEISPQSLLFNLDDTNQELTITTDVNWKITNKNWPEWVSVSPLSGTGNGTVQIKVTDNDKRASTSFELAIEYAEKQISIPIAFNVDKYTDGGYTIYQSSKKANPIKLIFLGDGYLPSHFNYGGLFDQNVNEAIEAVFEIEPYKTYREYFSVYKVAAFSKETGISSKVDNIQKNTAFSSTLLGGTGIEADFEKVFSYALLPPDIKKSDLKNTSICLVINADTYAGTCYTVSDGKSIAMVPVSRMEVPDYPYVTLFPNIVRHEFGGHGFGRLADEYQSYDETIPDEEKELLLTWQEGYNHFKNVSPYYSKEEVPWSRFIGKQDYPQVGIFEGGYCYTQGVTRSEEISCMDDNRPYFNAQSRYLIVERILQIAGEGELTYEKFIKKDVQKTPPPFTRGLIKPKDFKHLAPPILVME